MCFKLLLTVEVHGRGEDDSVIQNAPHAVLQPRCPDFITGIVPIQMLDEDSFDQAGSNINSYQSSSCGSSNSVSSSSSQVQSLQNIIQPAVYQVVQ